MNAKSQEDVQGFEYDWLACDAFGHVGVFSTGGAAYVPDAFLRDTDCYDTAIERLLNQQETTSARLWPKLEDGCINTWKLMSERGFYSFDADYQEGGYKLVGAPEDPLKLEQLGEDFVTVVSRFKFKNNFSCVQNLSKHDILDGGK